MLSRNHKATFGNVIRPLSLHLHRLGVTATHLTVVGLLFSAATALAFSRGAFLPGGLLLLIAGAADAFDGSVARTSGHVTPFGAFIDSVADRYSEFLAFTGLAWHYAESPLLLLVLASLAGSLMVSYTRAKAESLISSCEVGLMERPERIILLIFSALFDVMIPGLWLLAILTNLTALHRIYYTWKEIRATTNT